MKRLWLKRCMLRHLKNGNMIIAHFVGTNLQRRALTACMRDIMCQIPRTGSVIVALMILKKCLNGD